MQTQIIVPEKKIYILCQHHWVLTKFGCCNKWKCSKCGKLQVDSFNQVLMPGSLARKARNKRSQTAPTWQGLGPGGGVPAGGGGGNNITVVAATLGGLYSDSSTIAFNMNGQNVTSGNVVICGVLQGQTVTYQAAFLTKTSGTSTIGTIALDKTNAPAGKPTVGIYRIPITGTGTLTLTMDADAGSYLVMGCAEFTHFNASPVSTTTGVASGTGSGGSAVETTGSIVSTDLGVMFYVATEEGSDDQTRTAISDTVVYKNDLASSHQPGIIMYKIINSSPNTLTNTWPENVDWTLAYQLYKSD